MCMENKVGGYVERINVYMGIRNDQAKIRMFQERWRHPLELPEDEWVRPKFLQPIRTSLKLRRCTCVSFVFFYRRFS